MHKEKTLFFTSWVKSNILYVKDLFTENGFKTLEEIGVNIVNKRNWLCEYNIICKIFKRYEKTFNCRMCSYMYANISKIEVPRDVRNSKGP